MTDPIDPNEIQGEKNKTIPDKVIAIWNEMLIEKWKGYSVTIKQDDAVERIAKTPDIPRNDVFKLDYLEIEDIFRKAGWEVYYDKPGFNESGYAIFRFTKKKKGD